MSSDRHDPCFWLTELQGWQAFTSTGETERAVIWGQRPWVDAETCAVGTSRAQGREAGSTEVWFGAEASGVIDAVGLLEAYPGREQVRRGEGPRHSLEEVNDKMEVGLKKKQRSSLRSKRKNRSCEMSNDSEGAWSGVGLWLRS